MTEQTPSLSFLLWELGITEPDVVLNAALELIDATLAAGVISRTTDAQPGSPSEGDKYIMTAGRSGADWAGYGLNSIALYRSAAWTEITPSARMQFWVDDETSAIRWDGSAWQTLLYDNTRYIGSNFQTGTSYALVLADAGKVIDCANASPFDLQIPDNSSVAFPVNTLIDLNQGGAGLLSVSMVGTDTLRGNVNCIGQWNMMTLWKRATTEWVVIGGVA